MKGAAISNIATIKGKEYAICIEEKPPNGKYFFVAGKTIQESLEWRRAFIKASRDQDKRNTNQDSPEISKVDEQDEFQEVSYSNKRYSQADKSLDMSHNSPENPFEMIEEEKNPVHQ